MAVPDQIKQLRRDPSRLFQIAPREFEKVVAELLASFGWEVNVTPPTRDGGHDILAISRDATGLETVWAVECKRYGAERPVGVEVVRGLYAVKEALNVPQGLVVTTSRFTQDAKDFSNRVGGLQIADYDVLIDWISRYAPALTGEAHASHRLFQSCFVSYSNIDEVFATQLTTRLREEGIRVWFAPEDLRAGSKIHEEVASAIDRFDRLIVVLSENSIRSLWVQSEIRRARRREIRYKCRMLFPVSLVPFESLRKWELFDADVGQDVAAELREYFTLDFSNWRDPLHFEKQAQALIKGLKVL